MTPEREREAETGTGTGTAAETETETVAAVGRVREKLLGGARAGLLTIAVTVQFGLCLGQLLAHRDGYRWLWPQLAAFGALTLVAIGGAWLLVRRGGPSAAVRWAGAGVTLAASVTATAPLPAEAFLRPEHWAFGLVGWYALVLLFDLRPAAVCGFLALHLVLTAGQLLLAGAPGPAAFAAMGVTAISVCGFQLAVALVAGVLRGVAARAAAAAAEEERLRTEQLLAEHTHRDHRERYAALRGTTIPLLAGLADRSLDPDDADTRRRCAVEAARMRRLFAENDEVPDRLVHELGAGIDVAARNGVSVQLAVRGTPRPLPKEARRELVDQASAALASAESKARATVVRTASRIRVSVVSDGSSPPPGESGLRYVQVDTVMTENGLWLEAVWKPTAVSR